MESNAHVDSTELYDTVAALLSRERYAEVLELLERLGDGDNVRVAYARLLCLQKLGRVEEALTYSGEVESAYHDPVVSMFLASDRRFAFRPETEWASLIASLYVFKEAALVYREKKYGEALSLLASAELQNHPEILYARGRCLLKLGRLDEALNCAALLELEQEPARAKMLREKAKAYHPPILKTVPAAPPQPSDETVKDLEPPLPPPDPTTLDQVVSPALSPGLEPSPASAADAQLLLDAIAERDQLQEALTTQRTLVVHLQEQLADYETRNGELQRQLEAVREELHNLSEQRGTHEAAAHEATAAALRDLEIVRSERDLALEALKTSERLLGDAQQKATEQDDTIATLHTQLDDHKSHITDLQQEVAEVRQNAEALEEASIRLAALEREREASAANESVALQELESVRSERDQALESLKETERLLGEARRGLADHDGAASALRAQLDALEAQRRAYEESEAAYRAQLEEARAHGEALTTALEQSRRDSDTLHQHLAERDEALQEAAAHSEQQAAEVAALREQLARIESLGHEAGEREAGLRAQLDEALEREKSAARALEDTLQEKTILEDMLRQYEQELADAARSMLELRARLDETSGAETEVSTQLREDLAVALARTDELEGLLGERDKEIDRLTTRMAHVEQELERAREQAREAIERVDRERALPEKPAESFRNRMKRLEQLERIGNAMQGAERTFAFQKGDEILLTIHSSQASESEAQRLAGDVARDIKTEVHYDGRIQISVVSGSRTMATCTVGRTLDG